MFSFGKTTFSDSKAFSHVLNCLAMFNDLLLRGLKEEKSSFFSSAISFLIELYMPLRSVSLIQESFIYDLGFNSQTLSGSI